MKKTWAYVIAIVWTLFIATTCFLHPSNFKEFHWDSIFQIDKLVHFILFFNFAIFWLLTSSEISKKKQFLILIISVAFGFAIEFIQQTDSIGRSFDVMDGLADAIGALIGVLCAPFIAKNMHFIKKYLPFLARVY